MKNEIYARHGGALSKEWTAFFEQFSWYHPKDDFSEEEFNEVEKFNLTLIEEYEKHIHPEEDKVKLIKGLETLYNLYGDTFFRYYPSMRREENRENIQSVIDDRMKWWAKHQPVNLGVCNEGIVSAPDIGMKIVEHSENGYFLGTSKNGYPVLLENNDRILLKQEGKTFVIYEKDTEKMKKMYEHAQWIPESQALVIVRFL